MLRNSSLPSYLLLVKNPKASYSILPRISFTKLRTWQSRASVRSRVESLARKTLTSLGERTSGDCPFFGASFSSGPSTSLCRSVFVVCEQKQGDHRATRPTPDLLATLEREQIAVTPGSRPRSQLLATAFVFFLRQMRRLHSCPNARISRDILENCFSLLSVIKAGELSS